MITATLGPVYLSPFLGAGADWLCLLDPRLVPLVSWMGGKRRLASLILALLGLRPGRPIPAILGDLSWWGWLWPVVLDPVLGPQVCAILRSWRGEDPRALWFRLRDMGPVTDHVAHAAAQLLWLQARAASGVPVWWEGAGTWMQLGDGWAHFSPLALSAPAGGGARSRARLEVPNVLDAEAVPGDAGERGRGSRGPSGATGTPRPVGGASPREWG